jgi:glycogen debranching enzyme
MEAVARIAKKSVSFRDKHDEWMARAKRLTDTIINEYWAGEKFVAKVKGKPVDSLSLANYQPIILGKRLPQHIIDKVAEKLTIQDHWLTGIGLASESMQSERATFGISFVCGRVVGPMNMILTVGLQAAGKQKEADMIARRFCDHMKREGIILGFAPYNYYKHNGAKADQQIPPIATDGWPWSSWSANSFLTMVTGVIDN